VTAILPIQFAEKLDLAFDFGWRSAGAPQHARFWRDGVERVHHPISGLFSVLALAAGATAPRAKEFFSKL
jgi:hypothetical protein